MQYEVNDVDMGPATIDILSTAEAILASALGDQRFTASIGVDLSRTPVLRVLTEGPLGSTEKSFNLYEMTGLINVEQDTSISG